MMSYRTIILLGLGLGPLLVHPQSWTAAGVPFRTFEMFDIYADTIGDALYLSGTSSIDNDFTTNDQGISVYRNGQWDTLGVFSNSPFTVVRWRDTIVVGGGFDSINGVLMPNIAYFDSIGWHPYGNIPWGAIYRLKVVDDRLFALGSFLSADGHLCQGMAVREGSSWKNLGTADTTNNQIWQDIVMWRDTLYGTGSINFTGQPGKGIAYFDGQEWQILGPGILGGWGSGRSLAVYQDELYVSGSIQISAGNPGHGIMKWDGTQFLPVGTGLQDDNNTYQAPVGAIDLEVHNGLLWASGSFGHAGGMPAPTGIAAWNGSQWCGLPGDLRRPINTIAFFHDTLFAGPFHEANGVNVNCAAKLVDTHLLDSCNMVLSTEVPMLDQPATFHVYPNPAYQRVTVTCPPEVSMIRVINSLGQVVMITDHTSDRPMDVSRLTTGYYLVKGLDEKEVPVGRAGLMIE